MWEQVFRDRAVRRQAMVSAGGDRGVGVDVRAMGRRARIERVDERVRRLVLDPVGAPLVPHGLGADPAVSPRLHPKPVSTD
jgi:hypothetical protein